MNTRRAICCLLPLTFLLSGCFSTATPPNVAASMTAASHYIFRGVPQNERGVLQADLGVTLPIEGGGNFDVFGWGNVDLYGRTGDAALPNGNAGEFSELDVGASYSRQVDGAAVTMGLYSYNFPNGGGESTMEVFTVLAWSYMGVNPSVTFWYDFDEFDGLYVNGAVSREFEVDKQTILELGATLGWTDKDQAGYYFADESGLGDLVGSATVRRPIGHGATFFVNVSAATIIDNSLRDALDAADIAADNVWAGIGLAWNF